LIQKKRKKEKEKEKGKEYLLFFVIR